MLDSLKPLVVVLVLAAFAFALLKPLFVNFMLAEDFERRRNVWVVLTCAAFLCPSIWAYAVVAVPVVYWAVKNERHPTALYLLLLLAAPPVAVPIPAPLINTLFDLSTYRILSLALLIPAALRLRKAGASSAPGLAKSDLFLLAYGALQLILVMPYESPTNTLRRGFLFCIDVYVLYFVFSRGTISRAAMVDTMACLGLGCAVLAPIAVFEAAKGWVLYNEISGRWGAPNIFSYLFRGETLRAQASAGHSLTMGYLLAMALGLSLYLGNGVGSKRWLWTLCGVMALGLLATSSRAPMLVAGLVVALYLIMSPVGRRGLLGTVTTLAILAVPFSMTAVGQKFVASLPFIGTVEQFNVEYRQQLAEVSWRLIQQNPFFGDPFAMRYMEELRQGQGIIDLVNTYAGVALFNGLVGCTLFVLCFLFPLLRATALLRVGRATHAADVDLGASLVACLVGTLVMMATASFADGFEIVAWAFAGMCSAYPAMAREFAEQQSVPQYSQVMAPAVRARKQPAV